MGLGFWGLWVFGELRFRVLGAQGLWGLSFFWV